MSSKSSFQQIPHWQSLLSKQSYCTMPEGGDGDDSDEHGDDKSDDSDEHGDAKFDHLKLFVKYEIHTQLHCTVANASAASPGL